MNLFPVAPKYSYVDTWGAARSGGRQHMGTDIFASPGTPVFAVADGSVAFGENARGGITAIVRGRDGAAYYYAHLLGTEGVDRPVRAGETIGYVGNTGNAASTPAHLHFEVWPSGKRDSAVNPYDLLRAVEGGREPNPFLESPRSERPTDPAGAAFGSPSRSVLDLLGSPLASWPDTLRVGVRGPDVALVQYVIGVRPIDGIFGGLTDAGVRVFQARRAIAIDGVVGPQTWREVLR